MSLVEALHVDVRSILDFFERRWMPLRDVIGQLRRIPGRPWRAESYRQLRRRLRRIGITTNIVYRSHVASEAHEITKPLPRRGA